jgi:hypothetical protein
VYLWIDFCCLPQRRGKLSLSSEDRESFQSGLAKLAEILKSCDLMILDSPDYINRAWCYTELFVWLCKVAEVGYTENLEGSGIFESIQTRHLFNARHGQSDAHKFDKSIHANLSIRGYGGLADDPLNIYKPLRDYVHTTIDSASYNMGAYEAEYLPALVLFMCDSWHALQERECADRNDIELCLQVIVKALEFVNR